MISAEKMNIKFAIRRFKAPNLFININIILKYKLDIPVFHKIALHILSWFVLEKLVKSSKHSTLFLSFALENTCASILQLSCTS